MTIEEALQWARSSQTQQWDMVRASLWTTDQERDTWDAMNQTALIILAELVDELSRLAFKSSQEKI